MLVNVYLKSAQHAMNFNLRVTIGVCHCQVGSHVQLVLSISIVMEFEIIPILYEKSGRNTVPQISKLCDDIGMYQYLVRLVRFLN
jgi:hypothetical protein